MLLYRKCLIVLCIFIQDDQSGEIIFYLKGADVVMTSIVQYNDWLEEEVTIYVLLLYNKLGLYM